MPLTVQKFGGTSVANAEKIHRAARRAIRAHKAGHRVVIVVSAMGDTTDQLLALAHEVSSNPPKRELDVLLTTGEQVSIALMAMAINDAGCEAISLTAGQLGLVTDSVHTRARIRRIERQRLERELAAGKIVIIAGFQGIDDSGEITTLGRGASDTTAAALAAVLQADVCEIYTDVDGVYTADPRLVPDARKIDRISYDEMLELASAGAGVMHGRAIEFAMRFNVPMQVRSALTDAPGTMIVAPTEGMEAVAVRGVSLREDLAVVRLTGVPNVPGLAATVFAALAEKNIIVDDIIQNLYQNAESAILGFVVSSEDAAIARELADRLARDHEMGAVEFSEKVSKVSAVGVGMRSHSGVAATMFQALAREDINILAISTSEIVIGCVVPRQDGPRALAAVHAAFGLGDAVNENAASI
ncbi:MAG: aspartate kinase [Phycisphaerales bacterium]|nr:aspartate kinase [Phycisphaerales bacterium]